MLPYKVFPMFMLGPIRFNLYGVFFALGILLANFLAVRAAKINGIKKDIIDNLVIFIVLGAIVGARLFYVIFYWPSEMSFSFLDTFKVWEGGLAFYGGFIGAIISSFFYTRKHKLNFWVISDLMTIPIIAGHISGRIGDYLTGGHPGKITDLPWSIYLNGALRHPVVLYEIIGLVLIGFIIIKMKKRTNTKGSIFLFYIQLYAIQRIILDFFRIESTDPRLLGLTPTQYFVIAFLIISVLLVKRRKLKTS